METLGTKLRQKRRQLGLTLHELASRTGISKPYLSLIETGRVTNPPSDQKLRRLEESLGFAEGELLSQAHLQRTPRDVRVALQKLLVDKQAKTPSQVDLDDAYTSGVLNELVLKGNVQRVATHCVPIVNQVSAGYPKEFTDLSYPPRVADDYLSGPDLRDKDTFAARVSGQSMMPRYREGQIIIFSPAASIRAGDDCFVRFDDGQTTFKRIFFETDETGQPTVRLQPRNPAFEPRVVASKQISGIYKAVYKCQRADEE